MATVARMLIGTLGLLVGSGAGTGGLLAVAGFGTLTLVVMLLHGMTRNDGR